MFRHRSVLAPALAALTVLAALLIGSAAAAAERAVPVFSPQVKPYGRSYEQWAAAWWIWALAQPASSSPITDPTGAQCARGQGGPVWFLAGAFGGAVTRECQVPAGKALLFPVVNSPWIGFNDPPEHQTEEYIREQASASHFATNLHASVDGVAVADVSRYLEDSVIFEAPVPADNFFGLPGGFVTGPNVDSGYYLVVRPLPPGPHTIRFGGNLPPDFALDVAYKLEIIPGRDDPGR
jgi:hypothetical protein